ncbi:MAG: class I SAM-dependent methyltransferase [Deltaproteobacteria bacterium]|nr:class I SAM-dependent methyltransferase [Deltaproteobacteria bacterium]
MNTFSYLIYKKFRMLTAPIYLIIDLIPLNSVILDLGCGRGIITEEIKRRRAPKRYTGVDLNYKNTEFLRRRFPDFLFVSTDALEFVKICIDKNEQYDCIIISDMLYLIDDELKRELIANAYKILSNGGVMIIKEAGHNLLLFLQEYISVKILHLTEGTTINLQSVRFYEDVIREVTTNYVIINIRRLWYPHFIIVIKK